MFSSILKQFTASLYLVCLFHGVQSLSCYFCTLSYDSFALNQEPIPTEKSHNCLSPGTTRPQAKWFLGGPAIASLGIMWFQWVRALAFITLIHGNVSHWVLVNRAFSNTHFCTDFDTGHGIKNVNTIDTRLYTYKTTL